VPVLPPSPPPIVQPSVQQPPPPAVVQQNPPVTPPSVVQPPQQLAAVNPGVLRREIADWANSRPCTVLGGDVGDGGSVTLNGLANSGSVEDLRQGLTSLTSPGSINWRVTGVNPVFCAALNALRPVTASFGLPGASRLGLQMAEGKTQLHDGDPVRLRLVMPDFPARLRVDYISHDGNVQHLYPQLADPKDGIVADPPRLFGPGEAVNLGNPAWSVSEPYGTDMVIAVASSEPLFDRARPANAETANSYLRDLQSAIDNLRQRGVRVTGAVVTLEALPK